MTCKVGELVRWMLPLDNDYSYGYVEEIKRNLVVVRCTGYYSGLQVEVHMRYIDRQKGGGIFGGCENRHSKRSVTKA
jgi:hypothetical protein